MEKLSFAPDFDFCNNLCPQAVFVYGTNKEDGSPNFGTFTWFSYCWDGGMCVMAAVGGGKMTIDRIRATGIFSANLVTEPLLPLADYLGNNPGRKSSKMDAPIKIGRGAVLDVPILEDSPWVFELEVKQSVPLDGNEVFICKMRNLLVAKALTDGSLSAEEKVRQTAPVLWFGEGPYFPVGQNALGAAGDWKDLYKRGE